MIPITRYLVYSREKVEKDDYSFFLTIYLLAPLTILITVGITIGLGTTDFIRHLIYEQPNKLRDKV